MTVPVDRDAVLSDLETVPRETSKVSLVAHRISNKLVPKYGTKITAQRNGIFFMAITNMFQLFRLCMYSPYLRLVTPSYSRGDHRSKTLKKSNKK